MDDAAVITIMLHAIDARDWEAVRQCFADEFRADYTSLWGGTAQMLSPDTLVAQWKPFAEAFAATQHMTGPVVIADGLAQAHVCARHWMPGVEGGDVWTMYGHYVAAMRDGKITELTLQTYCVEGNARLPEIAGFGTPVFR